MKGVILAGGTGSRLHPLTLVTNKHLLPVYDWPMIYYPINTLIGMGVKEICIVLGGNSVGDIVNLLGDGNQFGVHITYVHQSYAGGIAHALKLTENFCGEDDFIVVLGDNVLLKSPDISGLLAPSIFITTSYHPQDFGVVTMEATDGVERITHIVEKPEDPTSSWIQTGVYAYSKSVWSKLDSIHVSKRGELEITDLNCLFIEDGNLGVVKLEQNTWFDAGLRGSLVDCGIMVRVAKNNGFFDSFLEIYDTKEVW